MPHTAPRTGTPQRTQPRWWAELPLIAMVYAAYSAGRLLARGSVSSAVDHGLGILEFEQALHIDFETPLNDLFTKHASLGIPADFAYASLHYIVTPAILVWLWKRRPTQYRVMRTWLMLSTLIGLIGFITLPTCPPRLLDASHGFVDTMAQYGSYGWWGGEASAPRGLGGLTNQYAAMPSLHVGWSLWCGIALYRHGRSGWAKAAGVAYPLLTTIIVMGTANHYFLDAAAGAAVMGLGFLLARPALRMTDRVWALFTARRTNGAPGDAGLGTAAGSEPAVADLVTADVRGAELVAADAAADPDLGVSAPSVSGGCETSAGEYIPQQSTRDADRNATAPADGAPAAAR
ncbi:phosphatase PAP2 family protein [Streptomyces buecherae]|uniref:phosphatase PAP2 family protein n=1 Tax=Streptomyces buecherae TaxID=2763006 RepID=UPI0036481FF1